MFAMATGMNVKDSLVQKRLKARAGMNMKDARSS